MDLLTLAAPRVENRAKLRRWPAAVCLSVYILAAGTASARHEPWADEAQSWLLARDASLLDLWTRLLHYEGTTGLWQTLLHLLTAVHVPYAGMQIAGWLLGVVAAAILLWRAPFPMPIRAVLPFSYFLCYQYSAVARSYDILPLLVFLCAAWFSTAASRPARFTLILCLMAAVSVHGMILAACIGMSALIGSPERRRLLPYAVTFLAISGILTAAAWPAADQAFVPAFNFSLDHLVDVFEKAFSTGLTGEPISSLILVTLSLPLLFRGGAAIFFLLTTLCLCAVNAIVYSQLWHFGVLFLAWIFALWIACDRVRDLQPTAPRNWGLVALVVVLAVQCYWTACAVRYDWNHAYSGGSAAVRGLRELNLAGRRIYAIGFACIAIQPYFSRNVFANWNDGRPYAYWDWSTRNHVNQDSLHLAETRPDYVIVGYKNEFEHGVWTDAVRKSGYRQIRHFEGNTFWQTRVFEPESFDLYAAPSVPRS